MVIRPQRSNPEAARSAFTLLEILIVVAILVVLAGVSSVYVFRYLDDAKVKRCIADVQTIGKAAQGYEIQFNVRPDSAQQLLAPPYGKPYLESPENLIDPWGHPYQYNSAGPNNSGLKPDVWTTTPDGLTIGNWPGGTQGLH